MNPTIPYTEAVNTNWGRGPVVLYITYVDGDHLYLRGGLDPNYRVTLTWDEEVEAWLNEHGDAVRVSDMCGRVVVPCPENPQPC